MDDTARRLLRDLGRSLAEAIAGSGDAGAALRRLREEGYSLYLLLDRSERVRNREGESHRPASIAGQEASAGIADGASAAESEILETPVTAARSRRAPAFRINASDLFFLRSIGIDPTRRGR